MDTQLAEINLTEQDLVALRHSASRRGLGLADAIRRLIALEQFIEDLDGRGCKLLVERRDHSMRQIVMR